jgi:hypothetical protein
MGVIDDYVDSVVTTIKRINPSLPKSEIERITRRVVKERLKDPSINMDNNVTGENHDITFTKLCDWIEKRNPVIAGNATFYKQPSELESPTSNMLRSLKLGRKAVKKLMYKYKAGSDEYLMYDLDQQNKKVIMNAEYGGSGTSTAAFYTEYSPPATTQMAQSIITTMAGLFESYVGDNQKFFNINECYDWMNITIKKNIEIPKWVVRVTADEVFRRIRTHFYMYDINDDNALHDYVFNCNEDELVYLYYANNIKAFIKNHSKIQNLIWNILNSLPLYEVAQGNEVPDGFKDKFDKADAYNKWMAKEMFLDPYNPPECIKSYLEELVDWCKDFVYVEYITPDSIIKLNNHKRNTVLLVDTDSNIINANIFVQFIEKEIFPGEAFGRKMMYNDMILVNVIASCLDKCVAGLLDYYGRCHHMDEKARGDLGMKNEFMFRRLFLMRTKKRYAASIVLREGNIIIPYKPEIKGMDFIKSGVTKEVSDIFSEMLMKYILYSDDIELHSLMKAIKDLEKDIYRNLKSGGTIYLKPQMYKAEDAYAKIKDDNGNIIGTKAWSLPVFRGTNAWNEMYPDSKITSFDRVKIIKLVASSPSDLDVIKDKYPSEYNKAIQKIFMSDRAEVRKGGLKVIAIPDKMKKIPDWIIPLIDYDMMISDIISTFRSVLDALDLNDVQFKTPNGKASITSCLVAL